MSNVIKFQQKETKTLWNNKTAKTDIRPWWRLTSKKGQVIELYWGPKKEAAEKKTAKQPLPRVNNPRKLSTEYKQELADTLNEYIEGQIEYHTENTDNPYAEGCTWLWSEGGGLNRREIDLRDYKTLDDLDEFERFEYWVEKLSDAELSEYCNPEYINGICYRENELYSVSMGEMELDEVNEVLDFKFQPTEADLSDISSLLSNCDFIHNGYVYTNLNYSRWSFILDVDALWEKFSTVDQMKSGT